MVQSAGCRIIDSGRQPDTDNPFNRNQQMYVDILTNKCTTFTPDPITGQITNKQWLSPDNGPDGTGSGSLVPQNICFENDNFFGFNKAAILDHDNGFMTPFCGNISSTDDIDYFAYPQDEGFRVFLYGNINVSEWGLPTDVVKTQYAWEYERNVLAAVVAERGLMTFRILRVGAVNAYRSLRGGKKGKGDDDDGDGDGDGEAGEGGEGTAGDAGADAGGEAAAEAAADAGGEAAGDAAAEAAFEAGVQAIASAGAEVAGEGTFTAATAEIPGVDIVVLLAVIASGFAQDIADSNCEYDDFQKPTLVSAASKGSKAACCRGHCAIAGEMSGCTRKGGAGYNASIFKCCLQDFDCFSKNSGSIPTVINNEDIFFESGITGTDELKLNSLCFNTTFKTDNNLPKISTCHPEVRGLNSQMCATVIGTYCTGGTPFAKNQTQLMDAWSENGVMEFENDQGESFTVKAPCLNFLARTLTGSTTFSKNICTWNDFLNAELNLTPELLDPVGLTVAQNTVEVLIESYMETHGSPIGKINADGYIESSDFLVWFFNLCKAYPFLCQQSLTNFCYDLTPDLLLSKPESIRWCGCYLQDKYYEDYDKYGILKQCSPLCNIKDNIPLIGDDGVVIPCTDTVCMIDDLSIKIVDSFTEGAIDFNQVCNSCGGSKIIKKYSSVYDNPGDTNITEFFEMAPLTIDDYNNITDAVNDNTSLVGYDQIDSDTSNTYPIQTDTDYKIILVRDTSKVYKNIQFNLGVPIVVPGTTNVIFYVESLTNDTVTALKAAGITSDNTLDPGDYSKNIFKIVNDDTGNTSPSPDGKFFYFRLNYFKAGQRVNNHGDTISQSYVQSILTDISQYNVGIINRNCTCTIKGNLDFIDEQIGNLNINNNCGNTDCRDSDGNRVPCGSDKVKLTNDDKVVNTITHTTTTVAGFNKLTDDERNQFVTTLSLSLFVVVALANIFLTFAPKHYRIILIVFSVIFIFVGMLAYIIFSNSFGVDNLIPAFQGFGGDSN